MTRDALQLFGSQKPIIGMIHLLPLPGYLDSPGIGGVIQQAVADLRALEEGGVDGVLVENEYDRPHRVKAAPETIAAMTRVTRAVVQEAERVIVGCEILLNDPHASLAVAKICGAHFIRTDYFVDAMTRPGYGEFAIDPDGLMAYRAAIDASDILVLADIQVKYATMISPRPLAESAELAARKGADVVIVTGDASGDAPSALQLRNAREGVRGFGIPLMVGSGFGARNAATLLAGCDGAIVGTSLMKNRTVDRAAVASLMQVVWKLRE